MRLVTCSLLFFLVLVPIKGRSSRHPVDMPLESFAVSNERAIDILRALAKQSHVVIGVSGELIGSDRTLISIEAKQATVRTVLDDICLKDPRYRWVEAKDGNIDVSVGKKRLEFDDLNIATLRIGILNSDDLVMLISNQPEVKTWKARTNCDIM